MKTVGHPPTRQISAHPTAEALREGGRLIDTLLEWPGADVSCVPKGVYRFKTLDEADRHLEECRARHMAEMAAKRRGG